MTDNFEKKLQALSQHTFDEQRNTLDDDVLKKLKASRLRAINSIKSKPSENNHATAITFPTWLSPVSGATAFASVALIVSSLWLHTDIKQQSIASPLDDIELLSSTDELEFYENLDFYIWLEDETQLEKDNSAS